MIKKKILKWGSIATVGLASIVSGCSSSQHKEGFEFKEQKIFDRLSLVERIKKIDERLVKNNDPDKVDLVVMLDDEYAEKHSNWDNRIFSIVKETSRLFKEKFGIELEVDSLQHFDSEDIDDIYYLIHQSVLESDLNGCDAVVAFSGQECTASGGAAVLLGNYSLVIDSMDKIIEIREVQHEVSHLFGAIDYTEDHPLYDIFSIMSYRWWGLTSEWDEFNAGMVEMHKDRSWELKKMPGHYFKDYINSFEDEKIRGDVTKFFLYTSTPVDTTRYIRECMDLGDKLLNLYPDDANINYLYATFFRNIRKGSIADHYYKKVWDLGTENPYILCDLAWWFRYDGADDAKEAAEKAARLAPDDSKILSNVGWAYYRAGDTDNAKKHLEKTFELDKHSYSFLLWFYEEQNDFENWFNTNERIIESDPFEGYYYNDFAKGLMWRFMDKLDDEKKKYVLELAIKAHELYPKDKDIQNTLKEAKKLNEDKIVKR